MANVNEFIAETFENSTLTLTAALEGIETADLIGID